VEIYTQALLNSLTLGALYALLALGLTLLFSVMGILYFAHGAMYMFGAYITFYIAFKLGLNYFLAAIVAIVVVAGLGYLIEKGLFKPVRGLILQPFFIAVGLNWFSESFGYAIFGTKPVGIPDILPGGIQIAGASITWLRIILVLAGLAVIVGLHLFLTRTKQGLSMRAFVEDPVAAALQGMSGNRVSSMAFIIAGGLAALAGLLVAPMYALTPTMGEHVTLNGLLIIGLGGMGSIPGALIAAFIIGFIDAFGAVTIGTEFTWGVVFLFVAVFLTIRPTGLMSTGH